MAPAANTCYLAAKRPSVRILYPHNDVILGARVDTARGVHTKRAPARRAPARALASGERLGSDRAGHSGYVGNKIRLNVRCYPFAPLTRAGQVHQLWHAESRFLSPFQARDILSSMSQVLSSACGLQLAMCGQIHMRLHHRLVSLNEFIARPLKSAGMPRKQPELQRHWQWQQCSRLQPATAAVGGPSAAEVPPSPHQQQQRQENFLISKFGDFVASNYIPLGLISAICFASLFPAPGVTAAKLELNLLATVGIFVISGLNLQVGMSIEG